jgi:uncharacterized membrane protein
MEKTVLKKIQDYFWAGLLVSLPLGITTYLGWWAITTLDQTIAPLLPWQNLFENAKGIYIPGYGLLVLILGLTTIGALAKGFVGKIFVSLSERLLFKLPMVGSVYATTKQISQAVLKKDAATFREVALVQYPSKGMWCLCFVTGAPIKEISSNLNVAKPVTIFVPTTPNPTSGFLLFVAKEDLIPLNLTVEAGLKLVVSAGIVHNEA